MEQNRYDALNFYFEKKFPLIRIGAKDKVPIEPWREFEHRSRSIKDFQNINWGVKLGTKFGENRYLYVMDVDARNGGLESFNLLLQAYGNFSQTLRVNTSNGGFHLYFASSKPLGKTKLSKGIDGMGVGSFVVGAGSIHPSGTLYQFEIEDEPSDLPDFIYDLVEQGGAKPQKLKSEDGALWVDSDSDSTSDPEIVPEGERDNWLTRKAGQLRHIGMGEAQIFEGLKHFNLKCKPPKPESDLKRIATSVSRYDAGADDLEIVRIKTPEKTQVVTSYMVGSSSVKELIRLQQIAPGLLREISDEILAHSKRPYPHFALASALSIMAGVAQGGFQVPNLEDDTRGDGSVSLYQWLTSPPGSGKNSYYRAIELYLLAVDRRLISSRVNSSYGLRSSLYCFNAVTLSIDEMQDEITRLSSQPGSPMYQVLTDIKELFNDLNELRAVMIKGAKFPSIVHPRLNIFSIGTTGGLKKHLSSELIGGGLLSRFLQWPEGELSDFNHGAIESYVPQQKHIDVLRNIFTRGLTEVGQGQDPERMFELIGKVNQKGETAPAHRPQTMAVSTVQFASQEPKDLLRAFRKEQDVVYRQLVVDGLAESEISPASIVARSPQIALKIATLAALARQSVTIEAQDVRWSIALIRALSDSLSKMIFGVAAESPFQKVCQKIIHNIGRFNGPVNRKQLLQASRIPSRDLDPAIIDLSMAGRIKAFVGETEIDLEGAKKIPRGTLFRLP